MSTSVAHDSMANAIRFLAVDAVEKAKSGHPGLPMGAADIATVLFRDVLKFDAADPHWPDRDRFVLSAGHGSMLLYALLYLTGVGGDKGLTIDDLKHFRQVGSKTPGHPEYGHTLGVETTTGPLGQGIATSVGMAIAERMLAAHFPGIVDHRTYVLASDGDLMEGVSQEAIAIAGHLRLSKLIVFYDDNGISIDGKTSLSDSVDQVARFKSAGWNASHIDGHDPEAIRDAVHAAQSSDKPTMIACKTTIGYGAPHKAGTNKAHGEALGAEEVAGARKNLNWPYEPFVVPEDILAAWRTVGARGAPKREAWKRALEALDPGMRAEFERRIRGDLPKDFDAVVDAYKRKLAAEAPEIATRKAGRGGAERDRAGGAGAGDQLGRSNPLEQHQGRRHRGNHRRRFLRPLHPLGHPRAWDGGGLQRHGGAWGDHSVGRLVPHLHRLLPPRAAARGADEDQGCACLHPRFDRPRRRRADPPADRANRLLAGDAQSLPVAPRRQRRDRRMLAGGARARPFAFDPGADPAEPASVAARPCRRESLRSRRLRDRAGQRRGGGVDLRLGLRGLARGRRPRPAQRSRDRGARGVRAVHGRLFRSAGGIPEGGHRRRRRSRSESRRRCASAGTRSSATARSSA